MRNIKFADEMFVLNQRHVVGICDLLIERGYNLNIWAYARVDTVKDNMLDKLKRAGFNWLALGIEAADDRVLTDVDKRYEVDEVYDTVRRIKDAGINIIGNYIFGLPEDTPETMQRTLDLALDLNCEFANFYSAMAYPGSPLYEEAIRRGWRLPDTWSGYSQHSVDTLPLPTRHISAGEVLSFRDRAFDTYFRHEPYLKMVKEKFGEATLAHIREMTSHTLERKYTKRKAKNEIPALDLYSLHSVFVTLSRLYHFQPAHVRAQHVRHAHGPVFLLIVLEHRDKRAANRQARAVQRVHVFGFARSAYLEFDVRAACLKRFGVAAGGNFLVRLLSRQPHLDVVGLRHRKAHVARAQHNRAVRQAEPLQHLFGVQRHRLELVVGRVGMGDLHHLDLLELMLPDEPAHVFAVRSRLAAKTRRVGRVFQRQRIAVQDLVAMNVGQRHFRGRNQKQIPLAARS